MELLRNRPLARRAAMTAVLGAILVPAFVGTAASDAAKQKKKYPVVTSVRPMNVAIGETLEIRGKNFLRGRDKNTVVFKRDGARAVFVKAPIGTARLLRVKVPDKLQEFFGLRDGVPVQTRFRLRILSQRFAKKFTSAGRSPMVVPPRPPSTTPPVAQPDGDCDGDGNLNRNDSDDDNDGLDDGVEVSLGLDPCKADTDDDGVADRWEFDCDRNGVLNRDQADDDSDLLDDQLETRIGTDPCVLDTEGDGVEDGYEYQSAIDLNDDEYQEPNASLPYPGPRPYPNPLFDDAAIDYDGDVLTLAEEQSLWKFTYSITRSDSRSLSPLSYSDGLQYSRFFRSADNRRHPALAAAGYDKQAAFLSWASGFGYRQVLLNDGTPSRWEERRAGCDFSGENFYKLFDVNRDCLEHNSDAFAPGEPTTYTNEVMYFDRDRNDFLSDDERDEDGDGLINYDESHGRMNPGYWAGCYAVEKPYYVPYAGTAVDNGDSDGDGVLDGADDQDHDDVPNLMELSRYESSGFVDWEKGTCNPPKDLDPEVTRHASSYGRVNPFNPCLPDTRSRTCARYINGETGAPFDGSPNWLALQ